MWAGGTAGEGRDVGVGSKKQSRHDLNDPCNRVQHLCILHLLYANRSLSINQKILQI